MPMVDRCGPEDLVGCSTHLSLQGPHVGEQTVSLAARTGDVTNAADLTGLEDTYVKSKSVL